MCLRCTRADLEDWSVQGLIWSFGGAQELIWSIGDDLRKHKELASTVAVHIKPFGPCKCSFIVNVLVCSLKVLI